MFQNSRRTLFPRTRTGAQTQNVGGQEVMQLRTAGLKVALSSQCSQVVEREAGQEEIQDGEVCQSEHCQGSQGIQ